MKFLSVICATGMTALALGYAAPAFADYPDRAITLIVPYAPGGATDTAARIWADAISKEFGQPVIVDNRPGASTNIGAEAVAKAAPDGYTLLVASFANVVNPSLLDNMPFDTETAFAPVTMIDSAPNIFVVNPEIPANTLQEFFDYVAAHPGELSWGSGGVGSSSYMTGELLKIRANLDIVGIPYSGGGSAAIIDLLNGQLAFMNDMPQVLLEHIKAGAARPLAVSSAERLPALPDVPTAQESGVEGFDVVAWHGVVATAGTPDEAIQALYHATVKVFQDPEVRARIEGLGLEPRGTSPEDFSKFFFGEITQWAEVIKEAGIHVE